MIRFLPSEVFAQAGELQFLISIKHIAEFPISQFAAFLLGIGHLGELFDYWLVFSIFGFELFIPNVINACTVYVAVNLLQVSRTYGVDTRSITVISGGIFGKPTNDWRCRYAKVRDGFIPPLPK